MQCTIISCFVNGMQQNKKGIQKCMPPKIYFKNEVISFL